MTDPCAKHNRFEQLSVAVGDLGYFGISMTESGFGIALLNVFVSYIGGGLAGALIGYRVKNPLIALIGVAAGYIGAGASLDIAKPWEIFLISFVATFVVFGVYKLLQRLQIDDKKIVPLSLGGGCYGALVAGIVGSGDKTGGFFGLTGKYAFQGAEISLGWPLIGLAAIVAFALVTGLIVIVGLEKTVGLRVSETDETAAWTRRTGRHLPRPTRTSRAASKGGGSQPKAPDQERWSPRGAARRPPFVSSGDRRTTPALVEAATGGRH